MAMLESPRICPALQTTVPLLTRDDPGMSRTPVELLKLIVAPELIVSTPLKTPLVQVKPAATAKLPGAVAVKVPPPRTMVLILTALVMLGALGEPVVMVAESAGPGTPLGLQFVGFCHAVDAVPVHVKLLALKHTVPASRHSAASTKVLLKQHILKGAMFRQSCAL